MACIPLPIMRPSIRQTVDFRGKYVHRYSMHVIQRQRKYPLTQKFWFR